MLGKPYSKEKEPVSQDVGCWNWCPAGSTKMGSSFCDDCPKTFIIVSGMPSSVQSTELKGNIMSRPSMESTPVTQWLKANGAEEFVEAFYDAGYEKMDDVFEEDIKMIVDEDGKKPGLAKSLIRSLKKKLEEEKKMLEPKPPERDSSVPKENTAVTQWLKENGAEKFVDAFYKEGYDDKEDVSEEVIDRLVPLPGIAQRLKRSLKKPEPKPKRDPLAVPSLPLGTELDLSTPELKTPEGITFKLPEALSTEVSGKEIPSPNSLPDGDWMVIARNSQLLYGFQMDKATPKKARRPVLHWKVAHTTDFVRAEHLEAKVTSELSYTEQSASYAKSGFNSQSASMGFPFCSASFARSEREKQASSSYHKRLYMTGIWRYPRATLYLENCTVVSPDFVDRIEKALASADPSTQLNKVFEEYGHTIPSEVLLGGQLYFQEKHEARGFIQESAVENTIKAAISAKVSTQVTNAEGSAGVSFQDGSAQKVTAHEIATRASFEAVGGDTTLASNPASWAGTVKDPNLWAVIANEGIHSTVDLLNDDLRSRVLAVWRTTPPAPHALDGHVVTIRTPAINPPVRVLGREVNASNQSTPHPVRMPDWVLSSPKGRGVAWRLSFSGHYGDKETKSNPLFWIELVGQNVLLALATSIHFDIFSDAPEHELAAIGLRQAVTNTGLPYFNRNVSGGAFATLASSEVKQLPLENASARRALWYVKPVDPAHYFGDTFADAYFLEQYDSHQVLSCQDDTSGGLPDDMRIAAVLLGFDAARPPDQVKINLPGIHTNVNEFSVLVNLDDKTDDKQKLASSCWVLKPLEDDKADGTDDRDTRIPPDVLARRDFYLQVKSKIAEEPSQGTEFEAKGEQQEWLYGLPYSTSSAVAIKSLDMEYKEDWHIGWREHTFVFGPDNRYLIVGWQVISWLRDGTNGSWWKQNEQILLTHYAAVHVKSQYDRACSWGFRVFYVEAKDYPFWGQTLS